MTDYKCANCQRKEGCPDYSPRGASDNGRMHLGDTRNPKDRSFYAGIPEEHLRQLGIKQ